MIWDWLLLSIDPARPHQVAGLVSWHARFMVLAWGILIPTAVLIARYFKVVPWQDWPRQLDSHFWWRTHLTFQIGGAALTAVALGLILLAGVSAGWHLHAVLGWAVVALTVVQVGSGFLRGTKGGPTAPAPDGSLNGDHFNMTPRRRLFERVHKSLGHALILVAGATILAGLWHANAPRWMWIIICAYWAGLVAVAVYCHLTRPRVTTYQAIWGPSRDLPGNR